MFYQEDALVPEDWTTIINVTALDERKKPILDFMKRFPEVMEKRTAEEAAKGSRVLDLTRSGSGVSNSGDEDSDTTHPAPETAPTPRYLQYSVKSPPVKSPGKLPFKPNLQDLQRRPSVHHPGEDSVRLASAKPEVAKSDVHTTLPCDVIWKEVRPDLRQALLSGVKYDKAMEWLDSDKGTQSLQQPRPRSDAREHDLLASTGPHFLGPEVYYKMADEVLDRMMAFGEQHAVWGSLDGHVNYPESNVESTADNPKKDPDYRDSGVADSESEDEESESEDGKSDDHSNTVSKRPRDDEDDDSDSDDGPIVPTKMSKRSRSSVVTRSSPKSSPKSRKSTKSSASGSKSSSGKSHRPSSLVSKPYRSLPVKELQVVETPDCDATSWLYYGIRVQLVSSTKTTTGQTLGFPEYEVHKHSSATLKQRWDSERYCAIIRKKPAPWKLMFRDRFSEFYFHKLGPMVLADVEEIIRSMKKHAQAFWERTHWVPMDPKSNEKSAELHKFRGMRRSALIRQNNALIRKVTGHKDFPESLLYEPGIWTVPDKSRPCIWQDPRVAELSGPKCLSLETQLDDLDAVEPARMQ